MESQETWTTAVESAALQAAWEYRIDRTRQTRWDREHIRTASCRLKTEEMAMLREECRAQGTTVYGLLRYMIAVYMEARFR